MALIEREYLVDALEGTSLDSDHLTRPGAQFLIISRIQQFLVPPVAGAAPTGLATVGTAAEAGPLCLL